MYIFRLVFSFSSDIYPAEELLDHIVVLVLVYWGTFILLPTVAAPINIPTNCIQGFPFLHILVNFVQKDIFLRVGGSEFLGFMYPSEEKDVTWLYSRDKL